MAAITTVSGLASGIQTNDMIEKILEIERRPIEQFRAQQDNLRARQAAYQDANTRLAAVKDAASELAQAGIFSSRTAKSGDETVAVATAGAGATPGDYLISVEKIARSHQVLSQTYSDLDVTTLGTGTLTITAGGRTTSLTVDSSNNTLVGLKDAINRANSNIRASIVQDGDSSYRLMISSKDTGTANAMTINASLSGGAAPAFTDLQSAQDAEVKLGTGTGAITLTRSTNLVQDLIPGVSLNLLKAQPGSPILVSVTQDTDKIEAAVKKLVDQFNNVVDFMNEQFKFDTDKNTGGLLLGDRTLRGLQDDLMRVFSSGVPGVTGSLAQVGLTLGGDGKMKFDAALFRDKVTENPTFVSSLFSLTSESTNATISLASAGAKAVVDGSSYALEITQAARQSRVTAGAAQAGALDADETLTVNGVQIQLTSGMTQTQVLAAINARSKDTGVKASATAADGTGSGSYLTFLSTGYGSKTRVSVVSSRSSADGVNSGLGSVAATQDNAAGETGTGTGQAGLDVAGTINGEAATGDGQFLTGNANNAKTDGLKLRITSASTGTLGSIKVFGGVAFMAKRELDAATDLTSGPIWLERTSLDQRIEDLNGTILKREEAIARREEALRAKFAAMESAMSQFQSQSSYLASQIASLNR